MKVEGEEAVGTEDKWVEEGEHEKVVGLDEREIGDDKAEEAQWEEAVEGGTEVVGKDGEVMSGGEQQQQRNVGKE